MRTGNLKKALRSYLAANLSVMLWGQPSAAKSSIVKQLAKLDGYEVVDLRLSQMDAVDLRGVPYVENGQTFWAKPSWWPKEGVNTILFLDEINQAPQSVQAPAYQLVLDRQVGEHRLPEATRVVAAGNRQSDRAITNKMGTALKNRFVHLDVEINNDDWVEWALTDGDIHESIIGFVRFRPNLLNELGKRSETQEESNRVNNVMESNAFATPRSWEFLNHTLTNGNVPRDLEYEIYSGCVGAGVATEFMAYLKYYRDMPDLDQILLNPLKAEIPTEQATLYALATGLGQRINADNFEQATTYFGRVGQKEYEAMAIQDAILCSPDLKRSKQVIKWCLENSQMMGL